MGKKEQAPALAAGAARTPDLCLFSAAPSRRTTQPTHTHTHRPQREFYVARRNVTRPRQTVYRTYKQCVRESILPVSCVSRRGGPAGRGQRRGRLRRQHPPDRVVAPDAVSTEDASWRPPLALNLAREVCPPARELSLPLSEGVGARGNLLERRPARSVAPGPGGWWWGCCGAARGGGARGGGVAGVGRGLVRWWWVGAAPPPPAGQGRAQWCGGGRFAWRG